MSLNIQALCHEKGWEINGCVRITIDKLPGIRAELVQLDNGWQEWGLEQFLEALTKWTKRNPNLFGAPEIILKRDNIIRLRT